MGVLFVDYTNTQLIVLLSPRSFRSSVLNVSLPPQVCCSVLDHRSL
jgi:hypothetical protein